MVGRLAFVVFTLAFMLAWMPYLHLDTKVKAYAAEIIVPDQYSTIQAAIDNANALDTIFVRSGTYYEHVVVNKTIAFIGEDRNTVIIDGGGTGVVVNIAANGVNMTGFTVRRSGTGGYIGDDPPMDPPVYPKTAGVYLRNVTNCRLFENNVVETYVGIQLEHGANHNVIANNTLRNNTWAGIGTHEACWNSFLSNNVTDNPDSVMVRVDSNNNTFSENIITATNWGVTIDRCYNNTISRNHIRSSNIGINLQKSDSNGIFGNDFRDNYVGIQVFTSQHNNVSENDLTRNYCAVEITDYSSDNEVFGNNVTENSYGVGFWFSDRNIVYENNVSRNGLYGVLVSSSRDNKFYYNNFVGSTQQMSISSHYFNSLDKGYPSGGNYWSDYVGKDSLNGPLQNETGCDGIGDIPYAIDGNNMDMYPLIKPYGSSHDVGAMVTVSKTVLAEGYNTTVAFNVTVINYGAQTEDFNFSFEMPGTDFETVLSLENRESTTFTFTLNTTEFLLGNYTASTFVSTVPGESDTADNNRTVNLRVVIPGDVSSTTQGVPDGTVNMRDINYSILLFNTKPSTPKWNPNADVNNDQIVNMRDIQIAILNFNKHE